jgi:Polyketide cyclase / dehydrase and lipid transport
MCRSSLLNDFQPIRSFICQVSAVLCSCLSVLPFFRDDELMSAPATDSFPANSNSTQHLPIFFLYLIMAIQQRSRNPLVRALILFCSMSIHVHSFQIPTVKSHNSNSPGLLHKSLRPRKSSYSSSTELQVWWFGGTENNDLEDEDSCELVAVRIERTSPNSRLISGEILVPTPMSDVWAILTDYNQLSTHVPNLVESKIIAPSSTIGSPGDGKCRCRLYQKGAQKIIGFEFGADVTMDMTEQIVNAHPSIDQRSNMIQQRRIKFKCVESMFFSNFDGDWVVTESLDENGDRMTQLAYKVDVRPKGPVPVAALEWRIREDVPTNLRAVKRAAMTVGEAGVLASRQPRRNFQDSVRRAVQFDRQTVSLPVMNWGEDETMAKYLQNE